MPPPRRRRGGDTVCSLIDCQVVAMLWIGSPWRIVIATTSKIRIAGLRTEPLF